jgi:hypothetical protein
MDMMRSGTPPVDTIVVFGCKIVGIRTFVPNKGLLVPKYLVHGFGNF